MLYCICHFQDGVDRFLTLREGGSGYWLHDIKEERSVAMEMVLYHRHYLSPAFIIQAADNSLEY